MVTKLTENKGQYPIPATQLRACGFARGEELLCYPGDDVCVILRERMTAKELIAAAYRLRELTQALIDQLAEGCGPCRDCAPECLPLSMIDDPGEIPLDLLRKAGIPVGAKLCYSVDPNSGAITVTEADYDYDLRDLPGDFVDMLDGEEGPSICFASLNRHLIKGDVIYDAGVSGRAGV